jgi:hypothetical protein
MAHAIQQVIKGAEGREERIQQAQAYIRRFEGTDVASQVLQVYREVRGETPTPALPKGGCTEREDLREK